jgi:hypothetical protein
MVRRYAYFWHLVIISKENKVFSPFTCVFNDTYNKKLFYLVIYFYRGKYIKNEMKEKSDDYLFFESSKRSIEKEYHVN